ncbi:hypothetical protein RM697_10220 [Ichthyenterobacterium sp. W332]|uniref:Uncharacterized protein n=1 Tax=Microcosmobacter mediterraneus TaxID=3075607 RepID=A0ABU2YLJ4_9FLAO|nr:hypothetical protein [Ichthyenterobacterium sp. W332]MDT0559025.1 hypothetical protein [Ichthyenterobacterium sp. W332]
MIKQFILVILVLPFLTIKAQTKVGHITLQYGEEIIEDDEKIVRISTEFNGKIYTLASRKNKYYIKVFESTEMSLVSTNEIELPDMKGKDLEFEDLAVIADRIYVFGSVYDRKEKISNLFGVEVALDGKLSNNVVKLFSTKVTKRREQGAFYFKDSPTGDRLLIMHATQFNKEDVIQYEVKLLDPNLDTAMEYIEKVPYEDRRGLEFTIADFDVSFDDDVFIVINESFRDRKSMTNNEKFQVLCFKSSNNYEKEVIDIKFTDKEIINCEMLATGSGKLHLAGFYSGVRKNGKAKKDLRGVYSSVIDVNTNEVEQLKFNEFDYDTKVKLIGERRAKKGKDVKPYYLTHSLIEKEDGGLILLSEYQLVVEGGTSGIGPLAFTPITYINNEIIVTSLGVDGSVEWSNVIPKKQRASFTVLSLGLFGFSGNGNFTVSGGIMVPLSVMGKGPEYLSAMPIYENGQLTVIFNDNKKNYGVTDIEDIKWLGNYNKAVPVAVMFDDKGNMTRLDQEKVEKYQLVLRPRVYHRKTDKDYIIYSSRKSEDKIGRMTIGR